MEGGKIMSSVGSEFPIQMRRVRHLKEEYLSLPDGAGEIGAVILEGILQEGEEAQASGDLVRILRAFSALQGCE